jgi:rubrerythrin
MKVPRGPSLPPRPNPRPHPERRTHLLNEDAMAKLSGPEREEKLLGTLREWQHIEREAIDTTTAIMETTKNPLIRQVMEIIRNDSVQHHRVQQFLIDSITIQAVTLTPEELAEIWERIEAHDAVEKKTIAMARECLGESRSLVQKAMLNYLLKDEEKHDHILQELEGFKTIHT